MTFYNIAANPKATPVTSACAATSLPLIPSSPFFSPPPESGMHGKFSFSLVGIVDDDRENFQRIPDRKIGKVTKRDKRYTCGIEYK